MLPILQRRFRALENSKSEMVAQLRRMPSDRLSLRPGDGKWSAAELLDHLVRVERGILQSVKEKLGQAKREPVKVGDRVGSLIVRNVLRSPLRVKVTEEVAHERPDPNVQADDAIAEWERVRAEWQDVLGHARGDELKTGVFSHPKSGWFTLPETVLFLRLHHDHHRAQLGRIAKALAATKTVAA